MYDTVKQYKKPFASLLDPKCSLSHLTCVPSVSESASPASSALSMLWVHLRQGGHQGFLCQAEWVLLVTTNAKNIGQTRLLLEEQVARQAPFSSPDWESVFRKSSHPPGLSLESSGWNQ